MPSETADRQEQVARYLLSATQRAYPHHWRQGRRAARLAHAGDGAAMRVLATERLRGIPELALRGLSLLGTPFPAAITEQALSAAEILQLQAGGARVVTLLDAQASCPPPHTSPLDFALHDLCHLAKFSDPAHYREQVGLFACVARALASERWQSEERTLDDKWRRDRDSVCADMNGSCIFLFAVLKMKLKMAARRRLAAHSGRAPSTSGPLCAAEEREFHELLGVFLDSLALDGELRDAARATSARRDAPEAALRLARHFRAQAPEMLEAKSAGEAAGPLLFCPAHVRAG